MAAVGDPDDFAALNAAGAFGDGVICFNVANFLIPWLKAFGHDIGFLKIDILQK